MFSCTFLATGTDDVTVRALIAPVESAARGGPRTGRARQSAWGRFRQHATTIAFAVTATAIAVLPAGAADTLTVILDRAEIMKLPEQVGTVVIGNPSIADVALQPGGTMVITGRGYGATNIIALDRSGATLMNTVVKVVGPRDNVVVVYRGVERESYFCMPKCERRVTLGDAPPSFDNIPSQAGTRSSPATAGGAAQP